MRQWSSFYSLLAHHKNFRFAFQSVLILTQRILYRRDAISTLNYRIQYKEYLQTWEEATSINVPTGQNTMITALSDLQPCATYCVRIVAIGQNNVESLAGPEIVIDTAGTLTPGWA